MNDSARFFLLVFVCFIGLPAAALGFAWLLDRLEKFARRVPSRPTRQAAESTPARREAPRPLSPERARTRREIAERVAQHYRNGRFQ